MKASFTCVLVACLACSMFASEDVFRYDVGHSAARPRFKLVAPGLPESAEESRLLVDVDPHGAGKWSFGWFTYGESNSRSVIVGLRDGTDLFVDLDRNQQLSDAEHIDPSNTSRTWRVDIGAEFFTDDNQFEHYERTILLRLSSRDEIEIATAGVMVGTTRVADEPMQAVRMDRNSNGQWFDAQDRILLDVNRDGRVHPIGERIACDAICRIDGKRFVLQSDLQGERLTLAELTGLGNLIPTVTMKSESPTIRDVSGTIASRSGVRVTVRSLGQSIECPVGEYRIEQLKMEVTEEGKSYLFRFAGLGLKEFPIKIGADASTEFDLIGEVELTAERSRMRDKDSLCVTFTPMLKSSTGTFLTGCLTGRSVPALENRLHAEAIHDGRVVDRNSTGFS